MGAFIWWIAILLLVGYIGKVVLEILGNVRGRRFYIRDFINRHLIIKKIDPVFKQILTDTFPYYHLLTPINQRLFEKRVQKFIDSKNFIPMGGLPDVAPEMKTLISASAVQLTFGIPGVYFQHFQDIYVYPDTYYSEGMDQYNAGEVHKTGLIMLSWRDFIEGYLDPNNSRNVGLHEMAHALRLENMVKNNEHQYLNWNDIHAFNEITVIESAKITSGEESIFRPYAALHYQEFFAVVIETFFEEPQKLMEYHPRLFMVTSRLLRQNPMDPNKRIT